MSRTRLAEVTASLLGAALLVVLPLAGTGGASLLDDLVTTTTSLVPDPFGSVVTTAVDTIDEIVPSELDTVASTTTAVPTTSTSTTIAPVSESQPAPMVTSEEPAGASDSDPTEPLVTGGARRPSTSSPLAPRATSRVAASTPTGDATATLPPEASLVVLSPAIESRGSSAVAGEAVVRRDLEVQLSLGGGYTRSAGVRSTVALFDRLSALRLAPNQVARLLAPFPVAGRATYTDDWGLPRSGPGELARNHEGVDVFADRGTPVIASANGVLARMASGGLGGVSLRLVASDGTFYYYAHLERFAPGLSEGDRVTKGRVLGFVGNTGNAGGTPSHLHYEIHPRGGSAVPPVPYLDRWLAESGDSVAMLAAAPASARPSALRQELKQRAARNPIATTAPEAAGTDLGPLQTVSSTRSVGLAGLLLVLIVVAWGLRRWAHQRTRPEVVTEGWTIVDLAALAASPAVEEIHVPEPVS